MKKLLTLFASLSMMMGASAASQYISRTDRTGVKPLMERKLMARQCMKVVETIESTYDQIKVNDYGRDVWLQVTSTDGKYKWCVDLAVPMSSLQYGVTYTMADMLDEYTYGTDLETDTTINFESLECVLSQQQDETIYMDCQIEGSDGNNYHVYYSQLTIPTETIEVDAGTMTTISINDQTATLGSFQIEMGNQDYDLAFCFSSDQIAGTYGKEDLYEEFQYTYIVDATGNIQLYDAEATITAINDTDYSIEGKLYGYNGKTYVVKAEYVVPKAEQEVTITSDNLIIDFTHFDLYMTLFGYGLTELTATTPEYHISAALLSYTGMVPGSYSSEGTTDYYIQSLKITDTEGHTTTLFAGTLDFDRSDDAWTAKGNALCWDNTRYNLDLRFDIPDATGKRSFSSSDMQIKDLCSRLGTFQVYGYDNSENWLSFVIEASELHSAHYTSEDLSMAYSANNYIVYNNDVYPIYACDVDIEVGRREFSVNGWFQAGSILWATECTGYLEGINTGDPDPYDASLEDGDIEVVFSLDEITQFDIHPGDNISIAADNGSATWATLISVDGNELPAGDYELGHKAQRGHCDGKYIYPTFYGKHKSNGKFVFPLWYCTTGTITVSYDAEGEISLECKATNTNGCRIHVVVNPQSAVIEQVEKEALNDGKFFEDNTFGIRYQGRQYNGWGQIRK